MSGSQAAGVSQRPAPGPPRAYHFPAFERATLDNGLGVIVSPVRKLPVVTALLIADAGHWRSRRGAMGLQTSLPAACSRARCGATATR